MSTDVWVVRFKELNEFGCRFGWYFYRPRCKCSCFSTKYKYETDRTLVDRLDVISSGEETCLAGFVYFRSCFENVHTRRSRDTVLANSGSIPRLEKAIWNAKTMSKY